MPEPAAAPGLRASLPMYDLPELRPFTDAWWMGVAMAAGRNGFAPVPLGLDRTDPPGAVWHRHDLLLSQCCGRDLVTHLSGRVAPVAIPCYRASGCSAGTYRSWIVARSRDSRRRLEDFRGGTAAVNCTGSHSGWVALGHTLARASISGRFFARALRTGAHRASLQAVRDGRADLAAVDCVTFALLAAVAGGEVADLRIVVESEPAPALPYVTSALRPVEQRAHLCRALVQAAADPELDIAQDALLIDGFLPVDGDPYARSTAMASAAAPALRELAAVLEIRESAAVRSSRPA